MGNIVSLMDGLYQYQIPLKEPSDEKEILNYNFPKKEQYWRRPKIPDVTRLPQKDKIEIIDIHRKRQEEGCYFLNNGELTYISGMHYDFMTFCNFEDFGDGGYPAYLDQQRMDFYFRDLVRHDSRCYGSIILKCRRCGMTAEEMCQAIYTLLEDFNCKIGLQSNEYQKKCLPELMHPIINVYAKRPKWMKEKWYAVNGKKPVNSLKLSSSTFDQDDEFITDENRHESMGGNILPYPTTASAMDGAKKKYIIMDEVFKWLSASSSDTLFVNKKCVVEYGIKGKVSMLSTMGDADTLVNAVKEGCKLYGESDPSVRDPNGRTTSGLYKWFVSAIHSADIPSEHRDIQYGKVNKERALEYVWNEINKHPKNSKNYIFELRRLPPEEKHALMAATDQSYFPIILVEARLKQLYKHPKDKKPYVRGNLIEDKNGKVWFEADEGGIWLVSQHPYFSEEKHIDTRNRFRIIDGVYFPPINPEGCCGYDPIRYKKDDTVSKSLSQAAGIVYQKHDYFGSGGANRFCALMLYRPEDPREGHREIFKAAKYWGYPIMAERQVESTKDEAERLNMVPFLLNSEDDGKWGVWTNPKRTEDGLQMLVTLFAPPKEPDDVDQLSIYPFEDGLEDKKNFDLKNTTPSHVTMAEIMLVHGLKQIRYTNMTDNSAMELLDRIHEIIVPRKHTA